MEFGERLKELREEKKLTRFALADILKVSYSTVSKYETNIRFPDKGILIALADFFDVSLDYLLCRNDIKETAEKILNESKKQSLISSPQKEYGTDKEFPAEAIEEIEKFKEFIHHKYRGQG